MLSAAVVVCYGGLILGGEVGVCMRNWELIVFFIFVVVRSLHVLC